MFHFHSHSSFENLVFAQMLLCIKGHSRFENLICFQMFLCIKVSHVLSHSSVSSDCKIPHECG
mgnify:CR=1 FL=1